jgi:8-oxo-dGTP pyrophosphatase MutT (NUDIX family)
MPASSVDPPPIRRHAAVAAVLREGARGAEVLLIRRAQDERDPWSGHMALPGGHREHGDSDMVHTATRETLEEVNLDLAVHGQLLGRLEMVRAYSAARRLDVAIAPLVFALDEPVSPRPNPAEVQEVIWASLGELSSGARMTTFSYQSDRARYQMPAFDVEGRIVWGLTYRILSALLSILSPTRGEGGPSGPGRAPTGGA